MEGLPDGPVAIREDFSPAIRFHAKVCCLTALGIIAIIGGAIATGCLYSRYKNMAFAIGGAVAGVGIITFLVARCCGGVSQEPIKAHPQADTQEKPTEEREPGSSQAPQTLQAPELPQAKKDELTILFELSSVGLESQVITFDNLRAINITSKNIGNIFTLRSTKFDLSHCLEPGKAYIINMTQQPLPFSLYVEFKRYDQQQTRSMEKFAFAIDSSGKITDFADTTYESFAQFLFAKVVSVKKLGEISFLTFETPQNRSIAVNAYSWK